LQGPASSVLAEIQSKAKPAAERQGGQVYGPSF
jgi:hypothetical protein